MKEYERLSQQMAAWLSQAGEIEFLVDRIYRASTSLDVPDEEYELLRRLEYAASLAMDGWSKAEAAFLSLPQAVEP